MKPLATIECPSCGAPHEIHNPGIVTVSCEYCGNTVYWNDDTIRDAGKQATLPEGFSRLYRGALGTIRKKRFQVLGRARYSFGKGFWDEWFIEFSDGSTAWLAEDNHEFTLEVKLENATPPPVDKLTPGKCIHLKKSGKEIQFIIEELGKAVCIGIEGSLPKELATDEEYRFAEGSSPDGKYTFTIEYDETPPTLFTGEWIAYDEIQMDDEGGRW